MTITEENEEELEQLKREDDEQQQQQQENHQNLTSTIESDNNDNIEETDIIENENLSDMNIDKHDDNLQRLSTIYETPSPQPEIEEDNDKNSSEKLIVYDIANINLLPKVKNSSNKKNKTHYSHLLILFFFSHQLFVQFQNQLLIELILIQHIQVLHLNLFLI